MISVIVTVLWCINVSAVEYQWLPNNDRFDSVVAIEAGGKPLSTGVLIRLRVVLTSANPIRGHSPGSLKVVTVWGMWNISKSYTPNCESNAYWKKDNPCKIWHGTDKKHCPLHDLKMLAFATNISLTYKLAPGRHPFFTPVATFASGSIFRGTWEWAGFGYIDKTHVQENKNLEVEYFTDEFVDCEEYFPKSWGYFFCIVNKNNLLGVSSGSPLYHQNHIFGIGSFSMIKGNDSLLVFTDVRRYNIRTPLFCLTQGEVLRIKWAANG